MSWALSCCSSEHSVHRGAPQQPPTSRCSATDLSRAFCTLKSGFGFQILDPTLSVVADYSEKRRKILSVLVDFMALEICAASSKKKKNKNNQKKRLWVYLTMLFPEQAEQSLWLNNAMNEKHFKTLPCLILPPTISFIPALILISLGAFWITNSFVCFHYQITKQNSN